MCYKFRVKNNNVDQLIKRIVDRHKRLYNSRFIISSKSPNVLMLKIKSDNACKKYNLNNSK